MPQVNITVGKATLSKLVALKAQYGSNSQVVAVAIDRMARDEIQWRDTVSASDLWDMFAPEAAYAELAKMAVEAIAEQIHDMRDGPDNIGMNDQEIAESLRGYAIEACNV